MHVKHHKPVVTEHAKLVLQVRLSLRETQAEFAKRFHVGWLTIHRWESGKSRDCNRIYKEILIRLHTRLAEEGRLVPEEVFDTLYRQELERKNELALSC